jgi:hypothetical protein
MANHCPINLGLRIEAIELGAPNKSKDWSAVPEGESLRRDFC